MIEKVISGGQTGVDQGGLEAGLKAGVKTGGRAPSGYYTEYGKDPNILRDKYHLEEAGDYRNRTIRNVQSSGGTVLLYISNSPGTRLTRNQCKLNNKPCIENPTASRLASWIETHGIEVLNVAGNRDSVWKHGFENAFDIVSGAIALVNKPEQRE